MKLKKYLFFLLAAVLFSTGCVSSRYIDIEVLTAPQDTLLQKMSAVAVAQNILLPEEKDCGEYYFFYNMKLYDSACRKEALASAFKDGLREMLDDSEIFYCAGDTVFPEAATAAQQMSGVEMAAYFPEADAMIVIDDFSITDETDYILTYFAGYAQTVAAVSATIRFFDLRSKSFITIRQFSDWVYWISEEMDYYGFLDIERQRGKLLEYLAYEAGKKFAVSVFPVWTAERRAILVAPFNDFIMQNAADAALRGDWKRAVYLWDGLSKEKGLKIRAASAFYNMAVCEELNGDFERALELLDKADLRRKRKIHHEYRKILQARIEEERKLDALEPDEAINE